MDIYYSLIIMTVSISASFVAFCIKKIFEFWLKRKEIDRQIRLTESYKFAIDGIVNVSQYINGLILATDELLKTMNSFEHGGGRKFMDKKIVEHDKFLDHVNSIKSGLNASLITYSIIFSEDMYEKLDKFMRDHRKVVLLFTKTAMNYDSNSWPSNYDTDDHGRRTINNLFYNELKRLSVDILNSFRKVTGLIGT